MSPPPPALNNKKNKNNELAAILLVLTRIPFPARIELSHKVVPTFWWKRSSTSTRIKKTYSNKDSFLNSTDDEGCISTLQKKSFINTSNLKWILIVNELLEGIQIGKISVKIRSYTALVRMPVKDKDISASKLSGWGEEANGRTSKAHAGKLIVDW